MDPPPPPPPPRCRSDSPHSHGHMAEARRVPFVSVSAAATAPLAEARKRKREDEADTAAALLGDSGAVGPGAGGGSLGAGGAGGAGGRGSETVRLEVRLSEPSDEGSSEFSYSELLQSWKIKKTPPLGLTPALDPTDPLANEEQERQEAEALARKFERKYGNPGKKKRKDRVQDLIDIGFGYDESDSFIDNSEAYDELVPASLTTKLGGFYINTGTLQFRTASDSEGEDPGKAVKRSQKLKICEESVMKKRKKKQEGGGTEEKKAKKIRTPKPGALALTCPRPEKKKRKKLMKDSLNLAAFLRRFGREKEVMRKKPSASANRVWSNQGDILSGSCPHPFLTTGSLSTVDQTAKPVVNKSLLGLATSSKVLQDLAGNLNFGFLDCPLPCSSAQGENHFQAVVAGQKVGGSVLTKGQISERSSLDLAKPPPLPGGLPVTLIKRIEDLRVASRQFDEEGRKKFFTLEMNNILLDIELQVQEQPVSVRSSIYSHLVAFVPCNREELLKRLKKLNLTVQDDRLKVPLLKLKLAVCRVMPEQIARYDMDCSARVAKQQSEEGEKNGLQEEDEEKPGRRMAGPRKKFVWDDKLRTLLCNLVRVKLESYELESQGLLSVEDYLKTFMETEVKPLWPKGWMQSRMLFKESRVVHSHLTGKLAKKKIVPTPNPKLKEVSWIRAPLAIAMSSAAPPPRTHPSSLSETICLSDSPDEDPAIASQETARSLAVTSSVVKSTNRSSPPLHPAISSTSLASSVGGRTENSASDSTSPSISRSTLVLSAPSAVSQSAGFGGTKSSGPTMPVQRQPMAKAHKPGAPVTSKPNLPCSSSPPKPQLQPTSSPLISSQAKAFCPPAMKHILATPSPGLALTSQLPASPTLVKSNNKSSCSNSHNSTTVSSQLNSKGPHIPSGLYSSLSKTSAATPLASSSSPSQLKPNQHQSSIITPVQGALTPSAHKNSSPAVKLSPQLSASMPIPTSSSPSPSPSVSSSPPSNLRALVFHNAQHDSSKSQLFRPPFSVQAGQAGSGQATYSPAVAQKTTTQCSSPATISHTNTSPGSSLSVTAPSSTALSASNGQHQKAPGGACQASNPVVSLAPVATVPVPSVTSQLSQGSSATVGLLGASPSSLPLNFGMLGGLVPISLPFQYPPLLNFTSPGGVVAMGGGSGGGNAAASGSSGYTLSQDISSGEGADTKRNSQ
uniref:Ubinuclein-2-like n=1 Tax=Scleropages formosus TaxID=113540 RepID=A0A8C9R3Q3_SCLFO